MSLIISILGLYLSFFSNFLSITVGKKYEKLFFRKLGIFSFVLVLICMIKNLIDIYISYLTMETDLKEVIVHFYPPLKLKSKGAFLFFFICADRSPFPDIL
jgi:hypothetical protein